MDIRFDKKVVLVTGGATGIGAACIAAFETSGAEVVCLDIKKPEQQNARFISCDVSNADSVQNALFQVSSLYGQVDVLVNNAGIQTYGTVTETTEAIWDTTLAVNVKGAFLCSKYSIPLMLQTKAPVIINIASVNGLGSIPNAAAYVSSKAAMLGLTKSIAVDYAPRLRCVAVCPGAVDTPMMQYELQQLPNETDRQQYMNEINGIHLLNRVAQPNEIADLVVFLASPKAGFINGHYFRVDGGLGIKI